MADASVPLFDPFILNFFRTTNLCVLAEVIGVFGIVSNMINIQIFKALGYQDGVNVTFTALAVSDLGALISQQLYNVLVMPLIEEYAMFMTKSQMETVLHYVIGYFIRVSSVITLFASVERCICVVFPLRVKTMVTTKVAVTVNVVIFLILTMYMFPPYYSVYIGSKYLPMVNRTIAYIYYQPYGQSVLKISYNITDLVLPYCTFLVLILCSAIIYVKIRSKAKWRLLVASGNVNGNGGLSVKEKKSVVMLVTVSVMCVMFLLPESVLFTVSGFIREMKMDGAYKDVTNLAITFTTLLQTINCSVTIFVYYNMSSKYRVQLHKLMLKLKV